MRPAFTHIALHVRDLAACVAFYRRFCGLAVVHERGGEQDRVVWLAEPGREKELIFVLLAGGPGREQAANDYSHLGFALASREDVDAAAFSSPRSPSTPAASWRSRRTSSRTVSTSCNTPKWGTAKFNSASGA